MKNLVGNKLFNRFVILVLHAAFSGSSAVEPWRYRLGVRTEDSQSSNPGSIPGSATNLLLSILNYSQYQGIEGVAGSGSPFGEPLA